MPYYFYILHNSRHSCCPLVSSTHHCFVAVWKWLLLLVLSQNQFVVLQVRFKALQVKFLPSVRRCSAQRGERKRKLNKSNWSCNGWFSIDIKKWKVGLCVQAEDEFEKKKEKNREAFVVLIYEKFIFKDRGVAVACVTKFRLLTNNLFEINYFSRGSLEGCVIRNQIEEKSIKLLNNSWRYWRMLTETPSADFCSETHLKFHSSTKNWGRCHFFLFLHKTDKVIVTNKLGIT